MTGDDLYSQGTADYKTGEAENLNKRVGKLYHFKFLFMKKLKTALAVVAAVAFIVAFSAFNFAHNDTKKATTKYFYYQVVSGAVNTSSPLYAQSMTIADFQQVNPVNCPSGNNADCVRAWEEGHTPTTTGAGDYTIRKL